MTLIIETPYKKIVSVDLEESAEKITNLVKSLVTEGNYMSINTREGMVFISGDLIKQSVFTVVE